MTKSLVLALIVAFPSASLAKAPEAQNELERAFLRSQESGFKIQPRTVERPAAPRHQPRSLCYTDGDLASGYCAQVVAASGLAHIEGCTQDWGTFNFCALILREADLSGAGIIKVQLQRYLKPSAFQLSGLVELGNGQIVTKQVSAPSLPYDPSRIAGSFEEIGN